jgi:hypothetical protein
MYVLIKCVYISGHCARFESPVTYSYEVGIHEFFFLGLLPTNVSMMWLNKSTLCNFRMLCIDLKLLISICCRCWQIMQSVVTVTQINFSLLCENKKGGNMLTHNESVKLGPSCP